MQNNPQVALNAGSRRRSSSTISGTRLSPLSLPRSLRQSGFASESLADHRQPERVERVVQEYVTFKQAVGSVPIGAVDAVRAHG